MSFINNLSGVHSPAVTATAPIGDAAPSDGGDARSLAGTAIGEIGHRVLAWVGQSLPGGDTASRAWTASSEVDSGFRPDPAELARRGDVYGLRDLASAIGQRTGGTPTQEGELRRSLEGFTRQAVVQLAGLSGGDADRQLAGMRDALGEATRTDGGEGMDGVISRLSAATRTLEQRNG